MSRRESRESMGFSAAGEAALQRLIDSFCRTTNRMGGFDDPALRLVIYGTSPTAPVANDAVHFHSAVHRTATPEVFEWVDGWLRANDVDNAHEVMRLPANDALTMVSRLCMPLRHGETLLGYMWVLDPDGDLPDEHQDLMVRVANSAAAIIWEDRQRLETRQAIAQNLIDDLVVGNPVERQRAHDSLHGEGLIATGAEVTAILVRYRTPADMDTRWAVDALAAAAQDFVDTLSPGRALRHSATDAALIIVSPDDPILHHVDAAGLGSLVLQTIEKERLPPGSTELGVSRPYTLLELAAARSEALRAIEVGKRLRPQERIFSWTDLGVYTLVGRFRPGPLRSEDLSTGLVELLREDRREYRETIETYLDQAGDVAATAAILGLHRATVYYRLHRVEQLLSTDLTDGEALLELHLGLKLARIKDPV